MRRSCAALTCAFLLGSTPAGAQGVKVLADLPSPADEPMGLAAAGEHLWVADMAGRSIIQIRKVDGSVVRRLGTPGLMPTGLAWQGETLFAADRWLDWIGRRRPASGADLSPIPYYEKWATGLAHDGRHLWVVDSQNSKIHRLDPEDGTTITSYQAPSDHATGIAFDGRYLWVADHGKNDLYMVDRESGKVIAIMPAPGPYPSALAADGEALWVADYQTRRLQRIALPGETPYLEDEPRKVRASYEVLYRALGSGAIAGLRAFVAVPGELPGQHRLSEPTFSPAPARFATDKWGQKVAVFELGKLGPGEVKRVSWQADFALYRVRFQIVPERVGEDFPAELKPYLEDDKKYDLSSGLVGELVDKLTKDKAGTYRRAREIYEHLTEVIRYDRSGGWNNAATVLKRGTGSCSEYTFALVALLRRAGIPARYVGAISERGDEASFDDVFHRWAEAYLPGYGWIPVDANAGQGKPPGERGSFFGGRSNRHVVTTTGGGASELLEWTYNSFETYGSEGGATIEVRPVARYRPLETKAEPEPHAARRVLAPRLLPQAEAARPPAAPGAAAPCRLGDPWLAAIAVLLAAGLGLAIGRAGRRRGS
ncbi:MAG: hypothetical protein HY744_04170 [Deltaproteobacteria bacterium]|nr:hypothetical protein [Deltaproteobacteria bacterium]